MSVLKLPHLETLCWQIVNPYGLEPYQILQRYESDWQRLGMPNLDETEKEFLLKLARAYNSPLLNELMEKALDPQLVEITLASIDAEILVECQSYFGGGSLIARRCNDFRRSFDIDLIVDSKIKFNRFRDYVDEGNNLFKSDRVRLTRRYVKQYELILMLEVNGRPIKLEIVTVDFALESPDYLDGLSVPCLSLIDCYCAKLLANSNRFEEESTFNRDLIDLCALRANTSLPEAALSKATAIYSKTTDKLIKAIAKFQRLPDRRQNCYDKLKIKSDYLPTLVDGLDALSADFNLEPTERTWSEQHRIDI